MLGNCRCYELYLLYLQREEKFFSRDITHVVTTRSLPTDQDRSTDTTGPSSATPSGQDASQPRTINPSLLDKTADNFVGASKSRFTFEVPSTRRVAATIADADTSKPTPAPAQVNVLQKAKALGIKIWNLEKLQRILVTMFEDGQPSHSHNTRSNATIVAPQPRAPKQNDLSQMIKNEQLHERGDRELGLGNSELIPLKGPHIYIRDMNEKTKPIMIREYPKVQRREEGEWPQFRSASSGKCPFVEEDSQSKQQAERERQREKERAALVKAKAQEKMDRRPLKSNLEEMKPPPRVARKEPLGESKSAGNSGASHTSHHLPPPTVEGTMKASLAFQRPGFVRGEPMASGMQQSNITSAIRSQMISSTAPVPGAKAGTSKEVHGLQRKVLERNNGPVGLVASQRMVDIAGTAARMGTANPRAAKQKAQEKLGYKPEPVLEDDGESEEEVKDTRKFSVQRTEKREPKPGYCENCREKFDDFDTVSGYSYRSTEVNDQTDSLGTAYSEPEAPQICNRQRELERIGRPSFHARSTSTCLA